MVKYNIIIQIYIKGLKKISDNKINLKKNANVIALMTNDNELS